MSGTFLGIAERSLYRTNPPVKVRPLFQASPDRTKWIALEMEFPNSGMLGWWQPPAESEQFKAWTFQTEESGTYDPAKDSHDRYFVRTPATPAIELIDFHHLAEPEDVRLCLTKEGIAADRCATRNLIFRCGDGALIGPMELVVREDRLFLEARETPTQLSEMPNHLEVTNWTNHVFMPPRFSLVKIGDFDLSNDVLFVKRMLRESRDIGSDVIARAKLTEKQISSFCNILETLPLNKSRQQRLRRLTRVAAALGEHISLQEDGLSSLLAIPDIADAIEREKEAARLRAVAEEQAQIEGLLVKQQELVRANAELAQASAALKERLSSDELRLVQVQSDFDLSIAETFLKAEENAATFLGNVALIKAAIGREVKSASDKSSWGERGRTSESICSTELLQVLNERFIGRGLNSSAAATLLSSWAAGFVPILHGDLAMDCLECVCDTLTGGENFVSSISPTTGEISDLLSTMGRSRTGSGTLESFLRRAESDGQLASVVFEGVNLCQIDNVLLPLLGDLSDGTRHRPSSQGPQVTNTRLGPWPSNVLVAGTFTPSSLSMPRSQRLWRYCNLVSPTRRGPAVKESNTGSLTGVTLSEWQQWIDADRSNANGPLQTLAKYVCAKMGSSSSYERSLAALAFGLEVNLAEITDQEKLRIFTRSAVIPALVTSHKDSRALLAGAPVELSEVDSDIVDIIGILDNSVPQNV
ncbi:coiled-coil domain-containing protein [Tunturibacter empetritectus]|uniref:Uncharacterized protein n=1 Tax=Tunturiibacter empetritectus TaxID=3069691 RepID=A0A7W8INN7_9BACT|nr:hypothetical protein [Edaphobacter lichenicola]MBB5319493.1 hypothetical protein [Edaphobacter lichenicola]